MKNFFILCCLWIACCAISAQEPCPQVIPALQQWKGGSGKLALPAEGNIVVNPADEAVLLSTAEILADDLSMMMGWDYSVKIGKPGKNDIYMALMKPDKELGDEGYKLSVNRYAGIEAPTRKGVFWGTRTLLQMLYKERVSHDASLHGQPLRRLLRCLLQYLLRAQGRIRSTYLWRSPAFP